MARVSSPFAISGTYSNLVVYKVGHNLYARTRSRLNGERFRKDPAFARSMEKAKQFGKAATLAKVLYYSLPKEVRKKGVFGRITGFIHKGLEEGKTRGRIEKELLVHFGRVSSVRPVQETLALPVSTYSKQPQCLSVWQVTKEGRLHCLSTAVLHYVQQRLEGVVTGIVPND